MLVKVLLEFNYEGEEGTVRLGTEIGKPTFSNEGLEHNYAIVSTFAKIYLDGTYPLRFPEKALFTLL